MKLRLWLVTAAAGLVLADASIVTLALPELLTTLDTTVEGVAAVIAVYTLVLALALLPAERLMRRHGPALVGGAGFVVFGIASALGALLYGWLCDRFTASRVMLANAALQLGCWHRMQVRWPLLALAVLVVALLGAALADRIIGSADPFGVDHDPGTTSVGPIVVAVDNDMMRERATGVDPDALTTTVKDA